MLAEVNGTRIFYETIGSGRPVYVLHGGLGYDHSYFRPWLDPWAERFEVVFYDHRGCGRSDRPGTMADVTHETLIDDLDALRAHLGDESFVIAGNSYGGVLAQEYALKYPERLDGMVLITSLPAFDYQDLLNEGARHRGTPEQVHAVENEFARGTGSDENLKRLAGIVLPLYFHRYDPEIGRQIGERIIYSAMAWDRGFDDLLPAWSVVDQLHEIQTPTLVVAGADDWATPMEVCSQRIHDGLPNSRMLTFEHSGHFPFIEEQDRFLTEVGDWIAALPSGFRGLGNAVAL